MRLEVTVSMLFTALAVGARAEPVSLRERHFNSGWTRAAQDPAPAPEPRPHAAPGQAPGGVHPEHSPYVHMVLTRKAFESFQARYPDTELASYIGDYLDEKPSRNGDDNAVEGAWDEDKSHETPFDEAAPMTRHFWSWRGGLFKGLPGFDSSINRAHKYWNGGLGLTGLFDRDWGKKGVKGEGVISLYRKGNKAKAYWYLGHVAHLVEDLTVPAHEHLWPHVTKDMDRYESYIAGRRGIARIQAVGGPVESFPDLKALFTATAQISDRYDCGNESGPLHGVDGTADKGARRKGGFTDRELDEMADALLPLAVSRVAALFKLFYAEVDTQAPRVSLVVSSEGILDALAHDGASGVDREGFRFYASEDGGPWKEFAAGGPRAAWTPAPGRSTAVKATAVDAAGNVGQSPVVYARAP